MTPLSEDSSRQGRHWEGYTRYIFLLAKFLLWALLLGGALWIAQTAAGVLVPLAVSLVIAYLLRPAIDWIVARGVTRALAIVLLLGAGMLVAGAFALFLYPTLASSTLKVVERAPLLATTLQTETLPWIESTTGYHFPPTLSEAFAQYGESLAGSLPTLASHFGEWLGVALSHSGEWMALLLNLVMIPIFTFYFLRDFDGGLGALAALVPPHYREVVGDRARRMDEVVGQWFRGQIEVALILAALYGASVGALFGLFGLDVQSGIAIGILSGLLNVIPYVGFVVGFGLALFVILIDWPGLAAVVALALVFKLVQLLESYLITPKIVGEKVGLSPVTVIIVLLAGGHLGGLTGILLSVPLAAALKVLLPDAIAWYRQTSFYKGVPAMPAPVHVLVQASPWSAPTSETPTTSPSPEGDMVRERDDDAPPGTDVALPAPTLAASDGVDPEPPFPPSREESAAEPSATPAPASPGNVVPG